MRAWRRRPKATSADRKVRVAAIRPASRRSLEVWLEPVGDLERLAPFDPGAHLDLVLGNGMVRQYSLVEVDEGQRGHRICVQLDPAGRGGSRAVHELAVGDVLTVSGPRNRFGLLEDSTSALLLAGGVGVTPLISMAARLSREGIAFELHAYAKDVDDLPLRDALLSCGFRDSVFLHFSDEGDSFRDGGPAALAAPSPGAALYTCGPTGFVDLARSRASASGWPEDRVVFERFTPVVHADTSPGTGDEPFEVIAASTGQRMTVSAQETIAEVLERHGYDSRRSCGQGYCGSCVTRVLDGRPDHRDDYQSPQERATNAQLNICCSRSLGPELTLDV